MHPRRTFAVPLLLVLPFTLPLALGSCASSRGKDFASPMLAMQAVADVAGTGDVEKADKIFGRGGSELLSSGDEVADREDALQVKQDIGERVAFEDQGEGRQIALIGTESWPFPIPLVFEKGFWHFDLESGVEEIANRRIGRNELQTIATLHAFADAQKEYVSVGRDGNPPAYAGRVFSSEGKHDGLYWPNAEGEPESPLGPLIAAASGEGYSHEGEGPRPYHGYLYRILTTQGANAPGGAMNYVDEQGRMTRGCAMVAWPVKRGNSGVMTFQVNQRGIVFQKDLGEDTEKLAQKIQAFDPDPSWEPARN